jgi:hypothetical protein
VAEKTAPDACSEMGASCQEGHRKHCLHCCGGTDTYRPYAEVRLCPVTDCDLRIFSFGKNPARKGVGGKGTHTGSDELKLSRE